MKKSILIFIFTFLGSFGLFKSQAQNAGNYTTNANSCEHITEGLNETIPEAGYGQLHLLTIANDFEISPEEIFSVNEVIPQILVREGDEFTGVELTFYEDSGDGEEGPGSQIQSLNPDFEIANLEQGIEDENGILYDRISLSLPLDEPIDFHGEDGTVYWIGIKLTGLTGNTSMWEATIENANTPNFTYFSDDNNGWISVEDEYNQTADGIMTVLGECQTLGSDECEHVTEGLNETIPEAGYGQLHLLTIANDFEISPEEIFSVNEVIPQILVREGDEFTGVELTFYEDSGEGPGSQIQSLNPDFEIANLEQGIEDENGILYDRISLSLPLDEPIDFDGEDGTVYWVGIKLTGLTGNTSMWEATIENANTPNFTYFSDDNGWISVEDEYDETADGIMTVLGECQSLGVENHELEKFTHYMQDDKLFIEAGNTINEVLIYNLLGQKVVETKFNNTSGNVDMNSFSSGIYIAKVNFNGKTKSIKIAKK